jgi:hypothetical protein
MLPEYLTIAATVLNKRAILNNKKPRKNKGFYRRLLGRYTSASNVIHMATTLRDYLAAIAYALGIAGVFYGAVTLMRIVSERPGLGADIASFGLLASMPLVLGGLLWGLRNIE